MKNIFSSANFPFSFYFIILLLLTDSHHILFIHSFAFSLRNIFGGKSTDLSSQLQKRQRERQTPSTSKTYEDYLTKQRKKQKNSDEFKDRKIEELKIPQLFYRTNLVPPPKHKHPFPPEHHPLYKKLPNQPPQHHRHHHYKETRLPGDAMIPFSLQYLRDRLKAVGKANEYSTTTEDFDNFAREIKKALKAPERRFDEMKYSKYLKEFGLYRTDNYFDKTQHIFYEKRMACNSSEELKELNHKIMEFNELAIKRRWYYELNPSQEIYQQNYSRFYDSRIAGSSLFHHIPPEKLILEAVKEWNDDVNEIHLVNEDDQEDENIQQKMESIQQDSDLNPKFQKIKDLTIPEIEQKIETLHYYTNTKNPLINWIPYPIRYFYQLIQLCRLQRITTNQRLQVFIPTLILNLFTAQQLKESGNWGLPFLPFIIQIILLASRRNVVTGDRLVRLHLDDEGERGRGKLGSSKETEYALKLFFLSFLPSSFIIFSLALLFLNQYLDMVGKLKFTLIATSLVTAWTTLQYFIPTNLSKLIRDYQKEIELFKDYLVYRKDMEKKQTEAPITVKKTYLIRTPEEEKALRTQKLNAEIPEDAGLYEYPLHEEFTYPYSPDLDTDWGFKVTEEGKIKEIEGSKYMNEDFRDMLKREGLYKTDPSVKKGFRRHGTKPHKTAEGVRMLKGKTKAFLMELMAKQKRKFKQHPERYKYPTMPRDYIESCTTFREKDFKNYEIKDLSDVLINDLPPGLREEWENVSDDDPVKQYLEQQRIEDIQTQQKIIEFIFDIPVEKGWAEGDFAEWTPNPSLNNPPLIYKGTWGFRDKRPDWYIRAEGLFPDTPNCKEQRHEILLNYGDYRRRLYDNGDPDVEMKPTDLLPVIREETHWDPPEDEEEEIVIPESKDPKK